MTQARSALSRSLTSLQDAAWAARRITVTCAPRAVLHAAQLHGQSSFPSHLLCSNPYISNQQLGCTLKGLLPMALHVAMDLHLINWSITGYCCPASPQAPQCDCSHTLLLIHRGPSWQLVAPVRGLSAVPIVQMLSSSVVLQGCVVLVVLLQVWRGRRLLRQL